MKSNYFAWLLISATLLAQSKPVPPNSALVTTSSAHSAAHPAEQDGVLKTYGKLPLSFEPNQGQADAQVKFLSRGSGYALFLTSQEAVLSFRQQDSQHDSKAGSGREANTDAVLHMQLVDAHPDALIAGVDELPGKTNYIRGNDPKKWNTNVANFAKVRYEKVFDGVDLVYYGNQGQLEYDFVVAAGANPDSIRLAFTGAHGVYVDRQSGDLVLKVGTRSKEIRFGKPVAYQEVAGNAKADRLLVAADYVVDSRNQVSFQLGLYDHSKTLLIDPTLAYSTYLGGTSNDYGTGIAVDGAGSAYVTGYTNSTTFPVTAGSFQTTCSGGCTGTTVDAFVTKLDPTGSFLVYSTYMGGGGNDYGNGIAVDGSGNAYIVGQTFSPNFPTTSGAFQITCGTGSCLAGDAFITKLNPSGSALIYSTYLGGKSLNQGNGIALDAAGNAYVTGYTESTDFPTTRGALKTTCACSKFADVFVTELNASGSTLLYSTYLGGTKQDVAYAIALDPSNNAYVTGFTQSTDFPTSPGAFQKTSGAMITGFVSALNSTGSALIYSTYLGGITTGTTPCETCATSIAVDSTGNAVVTGLTAESNFPTTPGAYQTVFKSGANGHDAFITKLNPGGTAVVFSTYLGGSKDDGVTGVAYDSAGNVWLRGNTASTDFPVTPGAFQTVSGGNFDAFVAELDPTGSLLLYSSYLGGSGVEYGGATRMLALDHQSPPNIYITGYTDSTNFPTTAGSIQPGLAGANDVFVSKFSPSPNVGLSPSSLNFGNQNVGTTSAPQIVTLTNTGNENLNVTGVSITGTNSHDFAETNNCSRVTPNATCSISVTFTPSISGNETANVSITDNATDSPQLVSLAGVGTGGGTTVVLSPTSLTFATQLVNSISAGQMVSLTNTGTATLTITSIAASGDFDQINTCGSSVAAGATCSITVKFKPTTLNTRTGSITVTDNATSSPQTVSLTGTGTYIQLSPTLLSFGTVAVGSSSAPQAITLKNTDSVAVGIQGVSFTGVAKGDYSQTNTCGSSVAAGASCSINVTFKPTATGTRTAKVSIADFGGGSPQTVQLTGTGQ
jgi:Beta-propeller repeat/Abnormal spindle-like microcephaly-assoc'd, ASPM-SPD-2-Hydin/Protein of unknown function (DUF1573)